VAAAVAALVSRGEPASSQPTTPPLPIVSGPIVGPGPMYPGLRPAVTPGTGPDDFGYLTEEHYLIWPRISPPPKIVE